MKKRILFIMLAAGILFTWTLSVQGVAQNEEIVGNEDAALIGLGTVSRVEVGQLVVKEYDYETDTEQDVNYRINDKTVFENIKLADLKVGDSIEVVYIEESGKRLATSISKEENYIEDDDLNTEADSVNINKGETIEEAAENPADVTNLPLNKI